MLRRLFLGRGGKSPRYDYTLERLKGDDGQGFVLIRLSDNQKLRWQTLAKSSGMQSFRVAGVSNYQGALQDRSFAPGKVLSLVPEPQNPYDANAVAIYDESRTRHIGYVPKSEAKYVSRCLAAGRKLQSISMWETVKGGRRVSLRVLIVEEGTKLDQSEIK